MELTEKERLLERFLELFRTRLDTPMIKFILEGLRDSPGSFWLESLGENGLLVCYYLRDFQNMAYKTGRNPYSLERDGKRLYPYKLELYSSTHGKDLLPKKWNIVRSDETPKKTVKAPKPPKVIEQRKRERAAKKDQIEYSAKRFAPNSTEDPFAHLTQQDLDEIDNLQMLITYHVEAPPFPNCD